MCQVIAVVNQKGGVAKTTSVYNIGYALSVMHKRVLLIDYDSQASLTVAVGMELDDTIEKNIGNVLTGTCELGEVAVSLASNENVTLDIIPSNNNITEKLGTALDLQGLLNGLNTIIETARTCYDYVLIDCPPTVADMFISALGVCDSVIAPVTSGDYLSYVSLHNILEDLYALQEERDVERPQFLGVVITRWKKNIANHKELYKHISNEYRVLGTVCETDAFMSAIGQGVPVALVRPATKQSRTAAQEYNKIAEFVVQSCEYSKGKRKTAGKKLIHK